MIDEKAKELGRLLGQTDEYKAVMRAREGLDEARLVLDGLERREQDGELGLRGGRGRDDDLGDRRLLGLLGKGRAGAERDGGDQGNPGHEGAFHDGSFLC